MINQTTPLTSNLQSDLSHQIFESVTSNYGTPSKVLQELLRAARLHLGMEVSFISQFQNDQCLFNYVDQADGIDCIKAGSQTPRDTSYCQRVIDGRLPEFAYNAQALPAACELPATQQLGIGAYLSVPIKLTDGSILGSFCCFSLQSDNSLTQKDLDLIKAFAEVAGKLIETDFQENRAKEETRQRVQAILDNDLISMVWQPIIDLDHGTVIGVESLARFSTSPVRSPNIWFSDAQNVGLADSLEERAIENGLAILDSLPREVYVACNVSAKALLSGKIPEFLSQMPLEKVVLEITEHDIINDYETLAQTLAPLRKQGMRLAIDDTGAGYASFRHILYLKPDVIKLDMSLTRDIDTDINRQILAGALMTFAKQTHSNLIAEGVETASELNTLRSLGVNNIQGYFFHKPMAIDNLLPLF